MIIKIYHVDSIIWLSFYQSIFYLGMTGRAALS